MVQMNGLEQFLEIARCPSCKETLTAVESGVSCHTCSRAYQYNTDGILLFAPNAGLTGADDNYRTQSVVEKYTGLYAFGYLVLKRGHMESLHRTVGELILSSSISKPPRFILDVGCGVGRATCDCASSFRDAFVVGIDRSELMLGMAHAIVTGDSDITLDLAACGFGKKTIRGFGVTNAFLVQGDAGCLPLADQVFDMVINVNLLDRLINVKSALTNMISVLKPGGAFIFTSPLNWTTPELWRTYPNETVILELFESSGLKLDMVFDGLMYREAHDIRSYSDWSTLVVKATKTT